MTESGKRWKFEEEVLKANDSKGTSKNVKMQSHRLEKTKIGESQGGEW